MAKAQQILERLQKKSAPIFQRKGYKISMVGEFTDVLDACAETTDMIAADNSMSKDKHNDGVELHKLVYNANIKVATRSSDGAWTMIEKQSHCIGLPFRVINN